MIKRRVAIQLLALMVMTPAKAVADNLPPLPVPHFTDAPSRIPEGPSRMVHFSFASTPQTASGYYLDDHIQQWYCPPGKDNPPVGGQLPSPWAGQQAYCQKEENWNGVSSGSSGSIMFPIRGEKHIDPGTLYVRVRLRWTKQGGTAVKEGGWSAWHRTLVEDTHRYKFTGTKGMHMQRVPAGSLHVNFDMSKHKPPVITAPGPAQVFHGGFKINISGSVEQHKNYSAWSCCDIQWKRALIIAAENQAYTQAHTPGTSAFPTPPEPWQNPQLLGLAVGKAYMEHGSSFHGFTYYSTLRPHDHSFGYRYWFRVRESYWPGGFDESSYYGPWSAWRSFVVQEPLMAATPNHSMRMLPGAHMAKPSSGQQQNSHQLVPRVGAPAGMHRTQHKIQQHNTGQLAPMQMLRVR